MKPSAAPKNVVYFANPWVDFSFMGILSMAALAGFYFWSRGQASDLALRVSLVLQWIINWPHFSATNFRLFRSKESLRQFPLTAFVIPWLVGAGVLASFCSPTGFAPIFVKLFLVWSPYHFSGQTIGLTLLYAKRAGLKIDPWFRRSLVCFVLGTYLLTMVRSEGSALGSTYYGIAYSGLNVPAVFATICDWAMRAGGVALLYFWYRQSRTQRQTPMAIFLIPAATQFGWFILGPHVPAFYVFVPLFHSLQYLLIAWAIQMKESRAEHPKPSKFSKTRATLIWSAVNIVGGAVLFYGLPHLAAAFKVEIFLATGIVIAGVQIHHFFVDGVIWKLRRMENKKSEPVQTQSKKWAEAA